MNESIENALYENGFTKVKGSFYQKDGISLQISIEDTLTTVVNRLVNFGIRSNQIVVKNALGITN